MDKIDKELVARRFARHRKTYCRCAVVQTEMADALVAALPRRVYHRAFEFGCGSGLLTGRLQAALEIGRLWRNDLVAESGGDFLPGDIETLQWPAALDLVAANAVWQWLERPDAVVRCMFDALRPGGVAAISSFAPGNLGEIAALLPVSLTYPAPTRFRAGFEAGFDTLFWSETERVLQFESPRAVLEHLKLTGVTGLHSGRWTRGRLLEFEREYRARFAVGDGVTLTYRPVLWVGGRKEQMT